jgi:hypothetical protein
MVRSERHGQQQGRASTRLSVNNHHHLIAILFQGAVAKQTRLVSLIARKSSVIVFFPVMQASNSSPSILCPACSLIETFTNPVSYI